MPLALPLRLLHTLALLLLMGLAGCANLPPRGPVPLSQALASAQVAGTRLGQLAQASLAQGRAQVAASGNPVVADLSGFRLLPTGEYAFDARAALTETAERSIDAQYYELHNDSAGAAFLQGLRAAAQRGVRVRLLVDDFHAGPAYPLLLALSRTPGAQVRLFNPLRHRVGPSLGRLLLSFNEFERVNRRMHNKLFVADNSVALYGGRNVADEYFMRSGQANFIDLDVVSVGPVVPALSTTFDAYWNSPHAWPAGQVPGAAAHGLGGADPLEATDPIQQKRLSEPLQLQLPPTDPLGHSSVREQLARGLLQMRWGRAQVQADPPSKVTDEAVPNRPSPAMQASLDVIAAARTEVAIVNPYFIPGEVGMRMMADAAKANIRTLIFTNSLASTDEPLAHRAYARYREAMLRLGMKLYELNPERLRESGSYGNFGRSQARLHGKAAVVDRRWLVVGSVNLDARSALWNTELSVAIDCPELTRDALAALGGEPWGGMYELALAPDGERLRWRALNAQGQAEDLEEEPHDSAWQRLIHWLQAHFISEEQL